MINLLNKFVCVGDLLECRIDLYPSHVKCKVAIKINNETVTCYYSINRKYNADKYEALRKIIPCLNPKSNGFIWVSDKEYYELRNGKTRIFCSGNLSERNGILFFNIEYINLSSLEKDYMTIQMQGVQTNIGFMNIISDSPRIFKLDKSVCTRSVEIVQLDLELKSKYNTIKDIIFQNKNIHECNLCVTNVKKCCRFLNEEDIKNWLLEWDIIINDTGD